MAEGSKEHGMSTIRLARRVTSIRVSPSTAASQKVRDLKAAGRDILDLTVGEPDFDTPDPIKAAAIAAIEAGDTLPISLQTPREGALSPLSGARRIERLGKTLARTRPPSQCVSVIDRIPAPPRAAEGY
jgi:hypothetical protein